jgi:hypothetical protein
MFVMIISREDACNNSAVFDWIFAAIASGASSKSMELESLKQVSGDE